MKLSETEHEIYLRFNQSNSVWVEFAFVKSEGRFLAFRWKRRSREVQGLIQYLPLLMD